MQHAQFLPSLWRTAVLFAVGILILIALIACGGDDQTAPAAGGSEPTKVPTPKVTLVPVATPTATPAPEPITAAAFYEVGSDEALIFGVMEKQVLSVNARDYARFMETCTPNATTSMSLAQLTHLFEERRGATGADKLNVINFAPDGYNIRNLEVELLRAPYGKATFDVYDFHILRGTVVKTFEKVDGSWYSESLPCGKG